MRLILTKDTLTELTADELASVNGGITTILIKTLQDCPELETVPTFPVLYCVTDTL
ncbi:MAG TPA: bacteriocin [Mycobacteriales bacterium]|jgi:bacteriocin-like protein